jgi:hypothetical protein
MPTTQEISLNPTSVKGQILTSNSSSRIGIDVGSSTAMILTAQSSTATGLAWGAPSSTAQAMTLISTTLISANTASVTLSSFNASSYDFMRLIMSSVGTASYHIPRVQFNSSAQTITFSRLSRIFGTGNTAQINAPTTTTALRGSSFGVDDSEVFASYHLDIFMSNVTSGVIGLQGIWSPGAEQVSYPSGAYDSEITMVFARIPISRSSLSQIIIAGDNTFAPGTLIKLYGIKGA